MKTIALTTFVALWGTTSSFAALWTSGHGDLEMIYDGIEWEAAFLLGEPGEPAIVSGVAQPVGSEVEADALDVLVGGTRQASAGVTDSGASSVFLLAQDEVLNASLGNPYVGFAVDEISPGLFVGDTITLSLVSVSGPGVFSLWETDAFAVDTVHMSSAPGSSAPDSVALAIDPGHFHFNVGFTEKGTYDVTFRSEGELVGGGTTGNNFTVRYQVLPEPGATFLLALGALPLLRRRRSS